MKEWPLRMTDDPIRRAALFAALLAATAWTPHAALAQDDPSPAGPTVRTMAAGTHYSAGGVHRFLLGDDYREVVARADLGGEKYKDIATALRLPIGTVMSRLFRARRQLEGELRDYAARDWGLKKAA